MSLVHLDAPGNFQRLNIKNNNCCVNVTSLIFTFYVVNIYGLWKVVAGTCCLFIYFIVAIIYLGIAILRCRRHITEMVRP